METQNHFSLWTSSNSNCSSNGGLGSRTNGPVSPGLAVKCEKSLNFSTAVGTSEEDEYGYHDRRKLSRDPMSHRIIEKRRRDRMNNCLADLSRLIPAEYLKKGRGRIEKTEIIEMAIKHMKHLHSVVCNQSSNANSANELPLENSHSLDNYDLESKLSSKEESAEHTPAGKPTDTSSELDHATKPETESVPPPINLEHFKLGYQECLSESMHYLVEVKGYYPGSSLCMQLICHLQKHCDKLLKGDRLNKPQAGDSTSTSDSPNSSKPHGSGSSSGDSCERLQMPKQEPVESSYDSSTYPTSQRYDQAMPQSREYAPACPRELPVRRDNLTLPNLSLFNIEQEQSRPATSQMMMRHSHESYPTETSPCPSLSADNSLYKFKNNIKQRFTAEHSTHHNGSSSGYLSAPPTKKSKYDESPSNDAQCYESHSDAASRGIAIFALHGDGTFYIPLTVDYSSLIPYLGAFSLKRTSRNPPLVLHPVTLSVCFQQNGSGFTRHTTNTGTSGTSSDFGASSLVKLQK